MLYEVITDPETIEKVEKFLEKLDDNDDVQEFFHNSYNFV